MGTSPKVLVTGLGHTGTSYTMQLFQACGWDLGSPLHHVNDKKGLEWKPLLDLSMDLATALGRTVQPMRPAWNRINLRDRELVRQQFRERIEGMDFPPVVKCPDFGQHVVLPLIAPAHVVFMQRSLDEWVVSMWGNPFARRNLTRADLFYGGAEGMGLILDALEASAIPYTIVSYPRVARDRDYAWARLGPLMEVDRTAFDRAYDSVTRPDWVGWTERNLDTSGERLGLRVRLQDWWNDVQGRVRDTRGRAVRYARRLYFGRVE